MTPQLVLGVVQSTYLQKGIFWPNSQNCTKYLEKIKFFLQKMVFKMIFGLKINNEKIKDLKN